MKKNLKILIYSLSFIGVFFILTNSCKKADEPVIPELSTTSISSITQQTASGGGNVSSDGGSPVTARGICWGTSADPTTSGSKTSDGSGTGSFTSAITGLTAGTSYHVRAYAINAVGTAYGNDVTFSSSEALIPTLTSTALSAITTTTASSGGNITSDGGAAITARGVCWSTTANPTTANNKTTDGTGTGSFTSALTGLTPNTGYFLRAYATNSTGTSYGIEISFTTLQPLTLATTPVTSITQTTASSGGNIVADGGSAVTARGVCWNTSTGPTTANSKTTDGSGSGSFTSAITGLTPGTTYYVRAYATNGDGTDYGNEVTFTSGAAGPTLTTTAITAITTSSATSGGNISSDGGATVTQHGICWATTSNPTISNSLTYDGPGSGTYSSNMTGLTPNTTYYVRAWATNSTGTSYGNELVFITLPVVLPTLTTTTASAITSTTASSGGDITSDGGAGVTDKGVVWNTLANPTTANFKTSEGIGTGVFVSSLTGLSPNTTYYYRAYAVNSAGTVYGNQASFSTLTDIPSISTSAITAIEVTSASGGGNITGNGGASITVSGLCWSTLQYPTANLGTKTTDGSASGPYTSSITGLTTNTTYYVRAYATNSVGTAYGSEVSFKTLAVPTIATNAASGITSSSATSGGNITYNGGTSVTASGICWSTSTGPTTSDNITTDGSATGSFSSDITGLGPHTLYYVRAYATNSVGTAYGNEVSFTTSYAVPSVTTTAITDITQNTANSGGNVTSDGGATITLRGICWSTSPEPTILDSKSTTTGQLGAYPRSMSGLTPNTTYYVRAFASNNIGTGYGAEISFTTLAAVLPTLTTTPITSITSTSASSGGVVSSDGGLSITARGVCWSTSLNPEITDSKTSETPGTGTFTSSITGLILGETYHVRAYATNSLGTSYGDDVNFTTVLAKGDTYQGGIIVYIFQSGDPGYVASETHGLIAAPSDQTSTQWGCSSTLIAGAGGFTLGTGNQNTTDIVAGCLTTSAAFTCSDLDLGGYTDWFLPSRDELVYVMSEITLPGYYYWCSTQVTASLAIRVRIDGVSSDWGKNNVYYVRAVRTF